MCGLSRVTTAQGQNCEKLIKSASDISSYRPTSVHSSRLQYQQFGSWGIWSLSFSIERQRPQAGLKMCFAHCYFTSSGRLTSMCRVMYVHSLTLEGCFHIHLEKEIFSVLTSGLFGTVSSSAWEAAADGSHRKAQGRFLLFIRGAEIPCAKPTSCT